MTCRSVPPPPSAVVRAPSSTVTLRPRGRRRRRGRRRERCAEVHCAADVVDLVTDDTANATASGPVWVETRSAGSALTLADGMEALTAALADMRMQEDDNDDALPCGLVRVEVALPPAAAPPLTWLAAQDAAQGNAQDALLLPRVYFRSRDPRPGFPDPDPDDDDNNNNKARTHTHDHTHPLACASIGAAAIWQDKDNNNPLDIDVWQDIHRWMSASAPHVRVYGGTRFDVYGTVSSEWAEFGSYFFVLPLVECVEYGYHTLLSINVAWGGHCHATNRASAIKRATRALAHAARHAPASALSMRTAKQRHAGHTPDEPTWHDMVNNILTRIDDDVDKEYNKEHPNNVLEDGLNYNNVNMMSPLKKVVMARRTDVHVEGEGMSAANMLAALRARDPGAYQLLLELPCGSAFLASTPERLYARRGRVVASEAVAGTRRRRQGDGEDTAMAVDLLLSTKEHEEFAIVRESVRQSLKDVCDGRVEAQVEKALIKQAAVQHLYGRFTARLPRLDSGTSPAVWDHNLMQSLHPTPAVCGHPRSRAFHALADTEPFDRGFYAGPFGVMSHAHVEFAVAIRSALVHPVEDDARARLVSVYAGVGVVAGATAGAEWLELNLKASQFMRLLAPLPRLREAPNMNTAWARAIVEECARCGVTRFCIAPGSRSSPLTAAAASHPNITAITCIDERSLAFYALGFSRGSQQQQHTHTPSAPVAIITSSGTAVSELLPAVVEASQSNIPLLVLTADRPPELHDTGANQTIPQHNMFTPFARHSYSLPPPDDVTPLRVALTQVSHALMRAGHASNPGPVHINCMFRDPLAPRDQEWERRILRGVEDSRWERGTSPYTLQLSDASSSIGDETVDVIVNFVNGAKRGLLVAGNLTRVEDAWAIEAISRHLGWPVVADAASMLRVGTTHANHLAAHFDHVLLHVPTHAALAPDVILQVGAQLTSKRALAFLEAAVVERGAAHIYAHGYLSRHDPNHTLTHRLIASPRALAKAIISHTRACGHAAQAYTQQVLMLSDAVGRAVETTLAEHEALTEPHVAHAVASTLPAGHALFLGNSMSIRDLDMYAPKTTTTPFSSSYTCPTAVGSSRGASGIDGVVSAAMGYAAGLDRPVTLLIGDVSFVYDVNGLLLAKEAGGKPPVTIVVVNNGGGGIFSFLPIKGSVPDAEFERFWTTPQSVNILQICAAHKVPYYRAASRRELAASLTAARKAHTHVVVEVVVPRNSDANVAFHKELNAAAVRATSKAMPMMMTLHGPTLEITSAWYERYSVVMRKPATTTQHRKSTTREGFYLHFKLAGGSAGVGEVAPLPGLHMESMLDCREQLELVCQRVVGTRVPATAGLLDGSIQDWIANQVGLQVHVLAPSVRFGLETAVLTALADACGVSLYALLRPTSAMAVDGVRTCGLVDSSDVIAKTVDEAVRLKARGFCTLKLKVGRRATPEQDAACVRAVREAVGPDVRLRVDANRAWTLPQAIEFASDVQDCQLEFIEEPVSNALDVEAFHVAVRIPVALDESVDRGEHAMLNLGSKEGVTALVVKPSRVGGLERAAAVVRYARARGLGVIVSSSFESEVGLSVLTHVAAALVDVAEVDDSEDGGDGGVAYEHGLGTFTWLEDDSQQYTACVADESGSLSLSLEASSAIISEEAKNNADEAATRVIDSVRRVSVGTHAYDFHVMSLDARRSGCTDGQPQQPTLLFLHGFLGDGEDWLPLMHALSHSFACVAVDIPGHGRSAVHSGNRDDDDAYAMHNVKRALAALMRDIAHSDDARYILVGYSMGARLALYTALRSVGLVAIDGVVLISGTAGLRDVDARNDRAHRDDLLARSLVADPNAFVRNWYAQPMWASLRFHPEFNTLLEKRTATAASSAKGLALALSGLSVGRQLDLWEEIDEQLPFRLLVVCGALDSKFVRIAQKLGDKAAGNNSIIDGDVERAGVYENEELAALMEYVFGEDEAVEGDTKVVAEEVGAATAGPPHVEVLTVSNAGHAVHVEAAASLVPGLRKFASGLSVHPTLEDVLRG
eukprot:jgi/Chlat1/3494/Chrsp23S03682